MNAAHLMTADVVSLHPDATIADAAQIMLDRGISGLPIVDQNKNLVGILTERDLLRRVELDSEKARSALFKFFANTSNTARSYVLSHGRKVSDVMTRHVITVTEETSLQDIVRLLESAQIRRLPVVRDSQLIGIVTMTDLVRLLLGKCPSPAMESNDEEIENRLNEELSRHPWRARQCRLAVRNGVVELWGTIYNEQEREAVRVAAENIPGVKEFRDHLTLTGLLSSYTPPPIDR